MTTTTPTPTIFTDNPLGDLVHELEAGDRVKFGDFDTIITATNRAETLPGMFATLVTYRDGFEIAPAGARCWIIERGMG